MPSRAPRGFGELFESGVDFILRLSAKLRDHGITGKFRSAMFGARSTHFNDVCSIHEYGREPAKTETVGGRK